MKFSTKETHVDANGIASLAIVKMLLNIMEKKELLSEEEIDIILNCAATEVNDIDDFEQLIEAKGVIEGMFQDNDYRVPTSPRELC